MIKTTKTDAKGQVYTELIPENEADVEELRRMEARGDLDARESFGDTDDEVDPDELENA